MNYIWYFLMVYVGSVGAWSFGQFMVIKCRNFERNFWPEITNVLFRNSINHMHKFLVIQSASNLMSNNVMNYSITLSDNTIYCLLSLTWHLQLDLLVESIRNYLVVNNNDRFIEYFHQTLWNWLFSTSENTNIQKIMKNFTQQYRSCMEYIKI